LDLSFYPLGRMFELPAGRTGSGFDWLPFDKLELQFYNIRHIMQHTGESASSRQLVLHLCLIRNQAIFPLDNSSS